MQKLFKRIIRYNRHILFLVVSGFWLWLLQIEATNLSGSIAVGYGLLLFVFLVLIGVSYSVVSYTWEYRVKKILSRTNRINIARVIILWAVLELLLSLAVSAIWMGRNGSWDNILPFLSLTPLIMATPLAFLVRFFGYFGTSALVGTATILLFQGKSWRKYAFVLWVGIFLLSGTSYLIYRQPNGESLKATIVSDKLENVTNNTYSNTQLVILPEYGLDGLSSDDSRKIFNLEHNQEIFFSGTQQIGESDGTHNVLQYGSSSKGYIESIDKPRLIVGGEYLSLPVEMVLRVAAPSVYDDFQVKRAVVKGKEPLKPFAISDDIILGNAACSSIIHPEDYRKLTRDGATVLANSASLEIFKGSRLFAFYHDGFAKFMAVANARPFLQSANNWKAFALDHNGNTLISINPTNAAELEIRTNSQKTPYTYLGEWPSILGGIYVLALLIGKVKIKLKPKR